jgi:hypothetical protein
MFELQPVQFAGILPLLSGIQQAVLPYAVCEGINPGRVFVDHPQNPAVALIWTGVGYYFLGGIPSGQTDLLSISHCLEEFLIPASRAMGETGYILITSPGWEEHIAQLLPGRAPITIFRRTFTFEPGAFYQAAGRLPELPRDLTLARMDETLAERSGLPPSWRSPQNFVQDGLGFAILSGEQIVSSCTSVFACRRGLEMDVNTAEEFRGRGLASIAAAAFIRECLRQNRQPNWETFWENEPSTKLAQKLGYQIKEEYPVTYWEEN